MNNILPLSGPTASAGEASNIADTVAVSVFNQHETICGHTIKLVSYNDKGDPATALNIARKLVGSNQDLLLNESFSSPENAIHPYLMKNHVVVMTSSAEASIVGATPANPTAFSYSPSNVQFATVMMNYAKAHNENNIGIMNDGTTFGDELGADIKQQAAKDGLTVKATETYSPTAVDLTTPLTQLKQAGVQTVVPVGFSGITAMVSGIKQIGWDPAVVDWGVFQDYGITASQLPKNTAELCSVPNSKGMLSPLNKELLKDTEAKEGGKVNSSLASTILEYTGLLSYKAAIEKAGSVDGTKVAAAFETISNLPTNLNGALYTYSSTEHTGIPTSALQMCSLTYGPYDLLNPLK